MVTTLWFEFIANHAKSFSTIFRSVVKTPKLRWFTWIFKHNIKIKITTNYKLNMKEY